jgi:hypothetical protein
MFAARIRIWGRPEEQKRHGLGTWDYDLEYAADLAEANRKKVSIKWKLWVDKTDVLGGRRWKRGLENKEGLMQTTTRKRGWNED